MNQSVLFIVLENYFVTNVRIKLLLYANEPELHLAK